MTPGDSENLIEILSPSSELAPVPPVSNFADLFGEMAGPASPNVSVVPLPLHPAGNGAVELPQLLWLVDGTVAEVVANCACASKMGATPSRIKTNNSQTLLSLFFPEAILLSKFFSINATLKINKLIRLTFFYLLLIGYNPFCFLVFKYYY
ncbi:hypothetical protein DC20_08735 [Rufibacter tibetensis]|uniref:Uncharacterized protein n=1 Tax=Rufibacter tibetensis TaxID=512763 RepID=A0A0P0CUS3_9BACT|nr:hypothetical protein DC20_08735 [Rufibacter tibetensis]